MTGRGNSKRADARQREIYEAAVDLFWEKGYFGTSMRDLAAAVGVQISSLYYYNGAKQDLLIQIMERTMLDLTRAVRDAVESAEGIREQLAAAVRAHVLFHGDHPREAFVTDSELRALEPENRERMLALRDAHQAIFERLIGEGVAGRLFDVPDVKLATYAITTMCTAVGTWYRPDGRLPIGDVAVQYVEMALRALAYTRRVSDLPHS